MSFLSSLSILISFWAFYACYRSQNTKLSPLEARYLSLTGQNLTVCTFDWCFFSTYTIGLSSYVVSSVRFKWFDLNLRKSIILTVVSFDPVAIKLSLQGLQSTVFMSDECTFLSDIVGLLPYLRSQIRSCLSTPTEQRISEEFGLKQRSSTLSVCSVRVYVLWILLFLLLSGFGSLR